MDIRGRSSDDQRWELDPESSFKKLWTFLLDYLIIFLFLAFLTLAFGYFILKH